MKTFLIFNTVSHVTHRHPLHRLATEGGYLVQYCEDCDVVHVDVGPVTLRLRSSALETLALVLQRASIELHHASPEEQTLRLRPSPLIN